MFGSLENRYRDAKIIFGEISKYNYYIERIMSGKLYSSYRDIKRGEKYLHEISTSISNGDAN